MSFLANLIKGKRVPPRAACVYGVGGIGKTTFASNWPDPICLQLEPGADEVGMDRSPLMTTYEQFMTALGELYEAEHGYQTLVVDSIYFLERLVWDHLCQVNSWDAIDGKHNDVQYQRGYKAAAALWRQEVLPGLTALREQRGMHVLLIGHTTHVKIEPPDAESYERYEPDLHKLVSALVRRWASDVLFAQYKVMTKTSNEGFNRERKRGIGTGERILRCTERPGWLAKNRLDMPDEIPFTWDAFGPYLTGQGGE